MHAVFRDWMYARKARRQWQIQENLIWRGGGVQSLVQKGLLNFFVTSWESRDDHLFLDVWTPVAVGAGPYCFANRGEQIIGGYTSRRGPRPVSNVLRKSVRFFIINIFLIKKLSRLKSGKWIGQILYPRRIELANIPSEWLRNPGKGTWGS